MRLLGKTLFLALGIASSLAVEAVVPERGSVVSKVTQVSDYIVPLPCLKCQGEDKWLVIGSGSRDIPMATGSKDSATGFFPVEYVTLANITPEGEIGGVITLEATVSFENTSFGTAPLSTLKNTFYTNQFYSNSPARGKPSISYLGTYEMKAGDFGSEFESFLVENKINFPTDLLFKVAYDQVAAGRYLKANIFLFPGVLMGIDINPEATTLGNLRSDRTYLRGPAESTLINELVEWTKALEPVYRAAFNNPGEDMVDPGLTLPPLRSLAIGMEGGFPVEVIEEKVEVSVPEMVISEHGKVVQDFMGQTAIDAMRVVEQAEQKTALKKGKDSSKKTPQHTVEAEKPKEEDPKNTPDQGKAEIPEGTEPKPGA